MKKKELESKVASLETNIMCLSCKDLLTDDERLALSSMELELAQYQKDLENGNYQLWGILS